MDDSGPIYCAEQIVVPQELPDILKGYTKAVLKQQPVNLLEFSAAYFADLVAAAKGISTIKPPTPAQLRRAFQHMASMPEAEVSHLQIACEAAGIAPTTLAQVLQAAGKPLVGKQAVPEVLLLLLTLSCSTFDEVVRGIFDVFGQPLAVPLFHQLLRFLAIKDPDNVDAAVLEETQRALEGEEVVTYEGLVGIPSLSAKLRR